MERILVTGGAGFIGSNFIRYMLEKYDDIEIVNLDKLTYAGNLNNLKDIEKDARYKFVKGDICNKHIVEKLVKISDIIVHFAAETHVDRAIIDAGSFVLTDVYGTYRLLEASKKFYIEKFVHISTDEVYGQIIKGSFSENNCLKPRNPYSASKAGAEMLVRSYFITHGLPVLITRSSNNFGPYQHPEKFIPKMIINTILNKKLPVYGTGKNIRDWIYVIDNCSAIDVVMRKGKNGEIYNIGAGNEWRNIDVVKLILRMMNGSENLIEFVEDRAGHDFRYSLNTKKIKKLGWKPIFEFKRALEITIKWYEENRWWWEKLI